MFTKITSVVALVWIFLCGASVYVMGNARPRVAEPPAADAPSLTGLEQGSNPLTDPSDPEAPAGVKFSTNRKVMPSLGVMIRRMKHRR
ncbi:MAG: hypothetical protein R3C05_12815 [Pirellulaceae bacterium]